MTLLLTITPSTSHNSNPLPPPWLVEIHSELWGKKELLGEIFRTVTLTENDFIELQRQLQELNPKRSSKKYEAADVLATKSAFLRSKDTPFDTDLGDGLLPRPVFDPSQPPSSDIVDSSSSSSSSDDDDDDDDPMDIDTHMAHLSKETTAIFPYTIRYVDLTVLKIERSSCATVDALPRPVG